jgi:hypothetical protein
VRSTGNGGAGSGCAASIDELLDRAVAAINRGDRVTGTALAEQVLAADGVNAQAEDLLAYLADAGEIRRLTILFADLIDSTVLATRDMSAHTRATGFWRCSGTPARMRTMPAGRC